MYPKNISVLLLVMMSSCTIHSNATQKASSRASQSMSRFVRWAESQIPQSVKTTLHNYNPTNSNFYKSATSGQATPQALNPRALKSLNLPSNTVSSESIEVQYQKMVHNISISTLPNDQKMAYIKDLQTARSTLMEQIRSTQQRTDAQPKNSNATPKSAKTPNAKNFYRGYNPYHVAGGIAALAAATSLLPDSDNSGDESAPKGYQTLSEIIETFRALPHNQYFDSHQMDPNKTFSGLGKVGSQEEQATEFIRVMTLWMQNMSSHLRQADWLRANTGETKPSESFFDIRHVTAKDLNGWFTSISRKTFTPFVEKIDAKPGEQHILHADFHGDIHSLITLLEKMTKEGLITQDLKLKPGVKMFLLGDYTDRGHYGTEVMYLLGRLGAANPENFHAVRGNHEDCDITAQYGFAKELASKFGDSAGGRLHLWLDGLHSLMPVAYYVGNGSGKYAQLCHGGIEQGYEPGELLDSSKKCQLLGQLNRETAVKSIIQSTRNPHIIKAMYSILPHMQDHVTLRSPQGLGFCWGDFNVDGSSIARYNNRRGAVEYSIDGVQTVLHDQKGYKGSVTTIIRGHQHGVKTPMQKEINNGHGCCSLAACGAGNTSRTPLRIDENKVDVLTLDVARDTEYHPEGNAHGDTALRVTVPSAHQRWEFQRMHYPVLGTSTYRGSEHYR